MSAVLVVLELFLESIVGLFACVIRGTIRGTVVAIESIVEFNCDHHCRRPMMIGSPSLDSYRRWWHSTW